MALPLASCVFVLSVFPATLSQVVARKDLSAVVPAGQASNYRPFIVTLAGGEFVLMINMNSSTDPLLVVMDSGLSLIHTYTTLTLGPLGYMGGSTAIRDSNGDAIAGSVRFAASELASGALPGGGSIGTSLNGPSFGSPNGGINEANFSVTGGNSLTWNQYDALWGLVGPTAVPISASGGNYRVEAVYDVDDTPSAGEVVLVLGDNNSNAWCVAIPLSDVINNLLPGHSPLLSYYPSLSLSNVDASSIGCAGDSLVVNNYSSGSLDRYSVKPPFNKLGSLPVGNSSGQKEYAYRVTGGYSVVYDPAARILTKVANWW
jgi:hypothetical protein